jgi:hypothetical protein
MTLKISRRHPGQPRLGREICQGEEEVCTKAQKREITLPVWEHGIVQDIWKVGLPSVEVVAGKRQGPGEFRVLDAKQ